MERPDNLMDRDRTDFFQLEFEHLPRFLPVLARGHVNDAQIKVLGWNPREVQSFLEELAPSLFDLRLGKGSGFRVCELGFLRHLFFRNGKVPQACLAFSKLNEIAVIPFLQLWLLFLFCLWPWFKLNLQAIPCVPRTESLEAPLRWS